MRNVDLYLNEIFKICISLDIKNLRDFCNKLNICIHQTEYVSYSKLDKNDIITIYTNPIIDYDVYVSDNFQIAHEIGHIFLHMFNAKANGKK